MSKEKLKVTAGARYYRCEDGDEKIGSGSAWTFAL